MSLSTTLLLCALLLGSFVSSAQDLSSWRSPEGGGINALYCYLRVNGVKCDYTDLLRELKSDSTTTYSAITLAHLAAKHGFPLRAVSLTVDELRSCPRPVIVHIDGESPEAGAFLLVFAMPRGSVDYMNGPSATIQKMSNEDFRRVWSGVVLLPEVDKKWNLVFYGGGFCLALFSVILLRSLCRKILPTN
jgi:ABC-type bacteriocin/lantibiotic exporter with double-glycine peptidase domain